MTDGVAPPGYMRVHKQLRVEFRGGWWHAFKGETQGRALERVLAEIDEGQWRICFVVNDRYSFVKRALIFLVSVFTALAIHPPPNLIIIAEHFEPMDPATEA